jgi:hypothetical protein
VLGIPQPILIFLALWTALAAAPLLWAGSAHSALRRDERVYRLTFVAAPLLLGVLWLHGVVFETGAWLMPREPALFRERAFELVAIAVPGVLVASVLVYRGVKAIDLAWNRRTAAISYGLQVFAWLLVRRVPASLVDFARTFEARFPAPVVTLHAESLALAAVLPLPVIAIAFLFARQALERRPKTA